jgi:hypothetical protein
MAPGFRPAGITLANRHELGRRGLLLEHRTVEGICSGTKLAADAAVSLLLLPGAGNGLVSPSELR